MPRASNALVPLVVRSYALLLAVESDVEWNDEWTDSQPNVRKRSCSETPKVPAM